MPNARPTAWTGGQYSLFRFVFGLYLALHFAQLVPWGAELFSSEGMLPDGSLSPFLHLFPNLFLLNDSPMFVQGALLSGVLLAALFAIGWYDRPAAVLLWLLWASLFGRNPLISNPGLPYVGLLLLLHAGLPSGSRGPYGAWSARNRVDPAGEWALPSDLQSVAWILMALGYSYSGWTKLSSPSWLDGSAVREVLENPLARPGLLRDSLLALPDVLLQLVTWGALAFELGFCVLALSRRLRPLAWGAMLAMHVSLIVLLDFADLSLGMVLLHLFTFDPAWIRPRRAADPALVFFDGACGLCHRAVRFGLAEDREGQAFRFAPLQGTTFEDSFSDETRAQLPDSIVLWTPGGRHHVRSDAVGHMLLALGGAWRLLGHALFLVPRPVRDGAYRAIASVRAKIFPKPNDLCPLRPPHLAARFDP